METSDIKEEKELVYGIWGSQLIFASERKVKDLAGVHEAIRQSDTWNEFEERMPEREWMLLMDRLREFVEDDVEGGYEIPSGDTSFDPDAIPGYADGDWPAWLAQDMLDWMPEEVKVKYGRVNSSVLNGFFLQFDPERKQGVVSALEERGYPCRENDRLIALAYGETPGGKHSSIPG